MSFQSQAFKKAVKKHGSTFPVELRLMTAQELELYPIRTSRKPAPDELWRSRTFMVQIYYLPDGIVRMTVHRTEVVGGKWKAGISWDQLQRLKRECGRGHLEAVEVFPPDDQVVNVSNMRHLFVLPERLPFSWRRREADRG